MKINKNNIDNLKKTDNKIRIKFILFGAGGGGGGGGGWKREGEGERSGVTRSPIGYSRRTSCK